MKRMKTRRIIRKHDEDEDKFAGPSGQGRVRSCAPPFVPFCPLLNLKGFTPLPPMVDIWGRKVKDRNPSPTHPDRRLWGAIGCHSLALFGGLAPHPHWKPPNYCSESQRTHKILQWEAYFGNNTAATLVLEQLDIRKASLFWWFHMSFYRVHNMSEVGYSDRLGAMNLNNFDEWIALLSNIR